MLFAAGVGVLGLYERREVQRLKQQTHYVADYSVEIKELYKMQITDPMSLKQALWIHLEKVLRYSGAVESWKVFDIQLALSDTSFLTLLEDLRKDKYDLRMMERSGDDDSDIELQREKVKQAEDEVVKYKNNVAKPYIVKAFVTFTCMQAAAEIKHKYKNGCCSKCACYDYDQL